MKQLQAKFEAEARDLLSKLGSDLSQAKRNAAEEINKTAARLTKQLRGSQSGTFVDVKNVNSAVSVTTKKTESENDEAKNSNENITFEKFMPNVSFANGNITREHEKLIPNSEKSLLNFSFAEFEKSRLLNSKSKSSIPEKASVSVVSNRVSKPNKISFTDSFKTSQLRNDSAKINSKIAQKINLFDDETPHKSQNVISSHHSEVKSLNVEILSPKRSFKSLHDPGLINLVNSTSKSVIKKSTSTRSINDPVDPDYEMRKSIFRIRTPVSKIQNFDFIENSLNSLSISMLTNN